MTTDHSMHGDEAAETCPAEIPRLEAVADNLAEARRHLTVMRRHIEAVTHEMRLATETLLIERTREARQVWAARTREMRLAEMRLVLAGRRVLELEAIMQLEGAGIRIDRGEDLQSELIGSANAALLLWADVHREVGLIARASGPGDLRLALAAIDPRSLAGGLEQLVLAAADLADRLMDPPEEVIG